MRLSPLRLHAEAHQPPLQDRRRTIERRTECLHAGQDDAGVERVVGVDLRFERCTADVEQPLQTDVELILAVEELRPRRVER